MCLSLPSYIYHRSSHSCLNLSSGVFVLLPSSAKDTESGIPTPFAAVTAGRAENAHCNVYGYKNP